MSDRQLFHKKWVRFEFDSKTWLGTVIGNGVHHCMDQLILNKTDPYKTADTFIKEQILAWENGSLQLNDKNVQELQVFEQELSAGIYRVLPIAIEYYENHIQWQEPVVSELTYKSIVGPGAGFPASKVFVKCKVDVVAQNNLYDWKVVKAFEDKPIARMIQAVVNCLLHAEHAGIMPRKFVYVEMLRTESYADKMAKYEADILVWERKKAAGEKGLRKPSAPRGEETPRLREVVFEIKDWHIQVVLELIDRIASEIQGENLMFTGRTIPNSNPMYGDLAGWEDFCTQVLGYNPYTGEIKEGIPAPTEQSNVPVAATEDELCF